MLKPQSTRTKYSDTDKIAKIELEAYSVLRTALIDQSNTTCEYITNLKDFFSYVKSPRVHLHVVGMLRFMFDINQPSLPTPFYSILVSISVFMALSRVFHSRNSSDNSLFSHFVLPVLILPCWSFQLYISQLYIFLRKSSSAPI